MSVKDPNYKQAQVDINHRMSAQLQQVSSMANSGSNWQQFFDDLKDYQAKFRYYEYDRSVTAEDLYQAFRARLLTELQEAAVYLGNDELVITLNRLIYPEDRKE